MPRARRELTGAVVAVTALPEVVPLPEEVAITTARISNVHLQKRGRAGAARFHVDVVDDRELVHALATAVGRDPVRHHVADVAIKVTRHAHHGGNLSVDVGNAEIRGQTELGSRLGRRRKIGKRRAHCRGEISIVEIPLAGHLGVHSLLRGDCEFPGVRVLEPRGVLELNADKIAGLGAGFRRIVTNRQLLPITGHGLGSDLNIIQKQLHQRVVDWIRPINEQDLNRLAWSDPGHAWQRADFSHIGPGCALCIRRRVKSRKTVEAVRIIDRQDLAVVSVHREEVKVRSAARLPIHNTEWIQTIRYHIEGEVIRVELVRLERQLDGPLIRSNLSCEDTAGIGTAENDVTIVVVDISAVSRYRHAKGVGASSQLEEGHSLHHIILRVIPSPGNPGKEICIHSQHRESGEVETNRKVRVAAISHRSRNRLIGHELI